MTRHSALRVVRLSAAYDLLVTVPFALWPTAVLALGGLARLHAALGLDGVAPDASDPFTVLFANFTGSLVTVWAVVRLVRPSLALGAADTAARVLFSLAMVVALGAGASPVMLLFLVPEVLWAIGQGAAVLAARRAQSGGPTGQGGRRSAVPTLGWRRADL